MGVVRAHVLVKGLVQGVFYRANTQRRAERLGVDGWVRNLPDGRVEAVFEGEEEAVRELIEWCKVGPPGAVVESVTVEWERPRGEPKGFRILR